MTTATKRSRATLAVSLAVAVLTLGAAAPLAAGAQPAPSAGTGAPLPPSKPVHDLKSIAGKWEGRYTTRAGASEAFAWTINEDGSSEVRPFEQKGVLHISEGKLDVITLLNEERQRGR